MRRAAVAGVMAGALWAPTAIAAPAATPPPENTCDGSWVGHFVDADTTEAIPFVAVELRRPSAGPPRYAKSDRDGHVRIEGLCAGRVEISASKLEHSPATRILELGVGTTVTTIALRPLHDHHSERVVVVHDEAQSDMGAAEELVGAQLAHTRGQGLGEVVAGVAGVTTLGGSAGGMRKPVIRGQVGRRNLIIFDGVPHAGQRWGIDHAPEVDPNAAGRITVIKGAATTRYGPDAIGGVVLVDPLPLLREPGIAGEVSTVGGSNPAGGGGAFRLDHAPVRVRGLAWRAEANFTRFRAALSPQYPLDNTGAQTWNAGGRIGYASERFDVVAGYRLMRMRAGICRCLRRSSPADFASAGSRGRPLGSELYTSEFAIERPRQTVDHHVAMTRARIALGPGGEIHARYAYQFNDRDEYDVVRGGVTGPQLSFGLGTHNGDVDWEHPARALGRDWTLVGTVGTRVSQQSNAFESNTTLIPDYRQVSGGAFVVERFVHPRLELEAGGRYEVLSRRAFLEERDFIAQRAGGRLDATTCTDRAGGGAQCATLRHAPSATAGVLARPLRRVPELSMRVDLNTSARVPTVDEQYLNGAAPSFPILGLGAQRLGVERTWGSTATLRYDGAWLFVEGAGYANLIKDYIYFRPSPQPGQCAPLSCTARGPLPVFAFEAIDALFGGGEARVGVATPGLPFEVDASGAWVRARNLSQGGPIAFVPADRYTLRGRYLWPDTEVSTRGFLELRGTFIARQRRVDPEADFAPPPPFAVLLGAGAGVEFPTDQLLMRLSLHGANLINRQYREYTSLLRYFADEPGWSVQLRFAIEFNAELGA